MQTCGKYHSLAAAALLLGTTLCLPAHAADSPEPIYWKQRVFSIPYQINRPATADDAPLEVRLLVSRDAGATWKTLETAQPQVKGFIYNAEEDGEYWFAVQTVDRFGRVHPPNDVRPELHVVVDTDPPKLEVDGRVNSRGDLVVTCRPNDKNLQEDSLSVGVQTGSGEFEPLRVPEGGESSAPFFREVTYTPPLGTRALKVRAEVSDLAGNRSVSQTEVDLLAASRSAAGNALVGVSGSRNDPPRQSAENAASSGAHAWSAAGGSQYPETSFGQGSVVNHGLLSPPQLADASERTTADSGAQTWPVDELALAPPAGAADRGGLLPRGRAAEQSAEVVSSETLPPPSEAARPAWTTRPASSLVAHGPDMGQAPQDAGPGLDSDATAGSTAPSDRAIPTPEEIPPGERVNPVTPIPVAAPGEYPDTGAPLINTAWPNTAPAGQDAGRPGEVGHAPGWQLVNSRTIAIDYEVASVGPWGVSQVELWGTRDGGQTWRRYAVDDDNRSPVTATVEGEGDYGFRVVVHSAGGFAAAPPQPGDPPEALVRVDLVRPEATIESVQQGSGNLADQIMIRWSADDAELAPNPVTLYYSAQPSGPWTIIAAGLQNTGQYAWRAERHLPEQLHVRLEVRDAAGNATTFQTAEPVVVQRPRPQVRIREVRPFGASAAQPGLPQR